MGYDFFYSFDRTQGKSSSDKTQSVKVQAFIDSNGIIRSIDTEIVCEGEMNTYDVKEFGTSCLFYDDFQEIIIEEGIVYENKIVYEWEAQGLLSSGDAALSAEAIGEVIIDVLETGGSEAEVYKDLFDSESSFQMFQEQKWEQLGSDWKANCYYDCHYIYLHQKDGYVEFLYYIYPDYDAMDVETAKALTIKCFVNMNDGKLDDTEFRIYSMTKEEYQAARKWQGRRIAIIEDGEIAGGGGNIPIPIPEDSEKKQKSDSGKLRYIYTNNDIGETSLCELLMEDLSTGNIENGRTSKFIADKETEWWSDVADEIRENLDAGWKMGEKYDFYCLSNNEQAENIHYRYYFYWNKPDEERERVLVADAWISEEGLEEMVIHWFISCKHFMNDVSRKREKETLKEEDIEAFLNFDWAAESVLMRDHTIEPEDSAQGWEFSIADINFDGKQEILISFPSNHCGGNSLYIYKQEGGNVSSYVDTIATPERCMLTGIDYKEISPYMDIALLDAYVNEDNKYRYLSLDCSSFVGDFHGGIYTVILYETIFDYGGEPKEIARIDYCAPEELEELYFLGKKVYEKGKLRDMITLYMDGYTEVAVNYKTAEKTFARDVIAISDEEKKQEVNELYESLKSMITKNTDKINLSEKNNVNYENVIEEEENKVERNFQPYVFGPIPTWEEPKQERHEYKDEIEWIKAVVKKNQDMIVDFLKNNPEEMKWVDISLFDFTKDGKGEVVLSKEYLAGLAGSTGVISYNYVYDQEGNEIFEFLSAWIASMEIYTESKGDSFYLYSKMQWGSHNDMALHNKIAKNEEWEEKLRIVEWDMRNEIEAENAIEENYYILDILMEDKQELWGDFYEKLIKIRDEETRDIRIEQFNKSLPNYENLEKSQLDICGSIYCSCNEIIMEIEGEQFTIEKF